MALSRVSSSHRETGPKTRNQPSQRARDAEQWGMSNWLDQYGNALPWSGPPGQQRGQRAPTYTPDAGNPANDAYWVPPMTAEQQGVWQGGQDAANSARQAAYGADPAISAARGAGDLRGYIQAIGALKQQGQQQRFVDQGGTPETWAGRFDQPWPVPKVAPPSGGAPGGPAPMPGGGGRALPPSQNAMFEGYNPGASTGIGSAMGGMQSALGGPGGAPMGGQMDALRAMMGGGMNFGSASGWGSPAGAYGGGASTGNPMMTQGRGIGPLLPPGFGGPRTPIDPGGYQPPVFNPGNRPPSVDMWGGGPPLQPFMPSMYGGQMPNDLIGGMQMFGYSPFGGSYNPGAMQGALNPFSGYY